MSRLIFIDALPFLRHAIDRGINKLEEDVERVIIDRTGTALQYLQALASLPAEFFGDVLFILSDGNGFLSSTGRGGDRVLYTLAGDDVDFYLRTNHLVPAGKAVHATNQGSRFHETGARLAHR